MNTVNLRVIFFCLLCGLITACVNQPKDCRLPLCSLDGIPETSGSYQSFLDALDKAHDVLKHNVSYYNYDIVYATFHLIEGGDAYGKRLDALIYVWCVQGRGCAELAWWKSPYPHTRMLSVSLYYAQFGTDICFVPNFREDAARFPTAERREREAEVAFVLANLDAINAKLQPMFATVKDASDLPVPIELR